MIELDLFILGVKYLKKIITYILFSTVLFAKSFTISIGAENPGTFMNGYSTDSNPRLDIEFMNHEKRLAFGLGAGINYINIDKENYLLTTNLSLNTAVNIVTNDLYSVYLGLNIGYPYGFVTVYHPESSLESLHTKFYYEIKFGTYYNDFNINIGLSTIILDEILNKENSSGTITRLSVNAGFLLF